MEDFLEFIKWNDPWLYEEYMKQKELQRGRELSALFLLAAPQTTGPACFYAICTNQHLFFSKTLSHLPIDIIPLLWYNISVIKERGKYIL